MATIYGPDINSKHGDGAAVLRSARRAGDQFVAIKAGGGNVGLYVAPQYHNQVRNARALGFKVAHYWVSGNQPIASQARYAIANTFDWRDGDAIAWDNEQLDSTGQIRGDKDSALWINTVSGSAGLDCPDAAVWHYGSSGSTFRDHGPWPHVKATGCTTWAAAYPGPPAMAGTALSWGIHQYTSGYRYGDGQLTDRNRTSKSLDAIFPTRGKKPASKPSSVGKTSTALTGSPGTQPSLAWKRLQILAASAKGPHRYTGPIDGRLGAFSWEGLQQALADRGLYKGVVDGDPDVLTFAALQAWAGVKSPSRVSQWTSITRPEWRLIGRKLNAL